MNARIFDIERFAIQDGPGIRTTVFFQGCGLHCPWCANPESQECKTYLMHNEKKCVSCLRCVEVCPRKAITVVDGKPKFDRLRCNVCQLCSSHCPNQAINYVGKQMKVDDILSIVQKDKTYYSVSGGGITLSGGEALLQIDATEYLLRACREKNIHTAVETCGQASRTNFERVARWTDLFLFDIKHVDEKKLKEITGVDLQLILGNLKYLVRQNPKNVIIRVPVIPEFNDDSDTIYAILELAKESGIKNVHLLPYHTLGIGKYHQLGKIYYNEMIKSISPDELIPYQKYGLEKGLQISIGGKELKYE